MESAQASTNPLPTLFTRAVHGNDPVQLISLDPGKEVFTFQGAPHSPRDLLMRIYGRPVRLSWRRYFRFSEQQPTPTLISFLRTLSTTLPKRASPSPAGRLTIGIDLEHRYEEVRRIIYRGFRGRIVASGFDFDDVVQEVYLGLIVRNRGKCPWDGRKSSFGHYIHMVTNCLLSNHRRKEARRPEKGAEIFSAELLGSYELEQGETGTKLALASFQRFLGESDRNQHVLLPLLEGKSKREIAEDLNLPESKISKALSHLRTTARNWQKS